MTEIEVFDPKKDYTHTPESQQAFDEAVAETKAHLQSGVFIRDTAYAEVPKRGSLTLEQVRSMFFVGELDALRNSTLWQTKKEIVTPEEEWARQPGEEGIKIKAAVSKGFVAVDAEVPQSQTQEGLPFTHAELTQRESLAFPGRRVYELSLYGEPHPGGNYPPTAMRGTYTRGQFIDRVSLKYPDGTRFRQIFFHKPQAESIVPPQPQQAK